MKTMKIIKNMKILKNNKKRILLLSGILMLLFTACGQPEELSADDTASIPTPAPTANVAVTAAPDATASPAPTQIPAATAAPTTVPAQAPAATAVPTTVPTQPPAATAVPTQAPAVTAAPTTAPAATATPAPTQPPAATAAPTTAPTQPPAATAAPTTAPTQAPAATAVPTTAPTQPPAPSPTEAPAEGSFLSLHGALSVDGTDLVDQNGEKIQLYGVSTHGLAWFPQYVNEDAFRTLHDDWNINCVRLALYTDEYGGYANGGDKENLKSIIRNGIAYATSQDMYVIVDWHVLNDRDPNVHKADALAFFEEITTEYADYTNIIYEICNEPNGHATWESVKSYANEVIPVIRAHDEDAVILVGSPTWSQDIDKAAADPLDFDNIMYTLHFYADTHRESLRSRLETCIDNGLPVFISEFGTCDASGNGGNNFDQTSKWLELIENYNLSFFSWSLCNKAETSAVISPSCSKTSDWTEGELSETGKWLRNYFRGKD